MTQNTARYGRKRSRVRFLVAARITHRARTLEYYVSRVCIVSRLWPSWHGWESPCGNAKVKKERARQPLAKRARAVLYRIPQNGVRAIENSAGRESLQTYRVYDHVLYYSSLVYFSILYTIIYMFPTICLVFFYIWYNLHCTYRRRSCCPANRRPCRQLWTHKTHKEYIVEQFHTRFDGLRDRKLDLLKMHLRNVWSFVLISPSKWLQMSTKYIYISNRIPPKNFTNQINKTLNIL